MHLPVLYKHKLYGFAAIWCQIFLQVTSKIYSMEKHRQIDASFFTVGLFRSTSYFVLLALARSDVQDCGANRAMLIINSS